MAKKLRTETVISDDVKKIIEEERKRVLCPLIVAECRKEGCAFWRGGRCGLVG